jgi:hypothetical protein
MLTQTVVKFAAKSTSLVLCNLCDLLFKRFPCDDLSLQISCPLFDPTMHVV